MLRKNQLCKWKNMLSCSLSETPAYGVVFQNSDAILFLNINLFVNIFI